MPNGKGKIYFLPNKPSSVQVNAKSTLQIVVGHTTKIRRLSYNAPMATYLTDDGICLRVTDFSETSQIVGMFTRRHGLVPLIAKGAKRASKKNVMSGPLDLLTSGEVVFVPAKESAGGGGSGGGVQLGTLAAWELADHRRALRGNLAALNAAMMCAEITTHLVHPLDPHEELFGDLEAALSLLGAESAVAGSGESASAIGRVLVAYVKAALMAAGYWPQLGACLKCAKPPGDGSIRFSVRAGGILCGSNGGGCHVEHAGMTMAVPGRVVVALERLPLPREIQAHPPERPADAAALHIALQMLLAQVEAITDKGVRTRGLLGSIFENAKRKAQDAT
jgi:DNA repair protein RecO